MTDADKKLYDKAEELFCQNCKLRTEQCLFAYRKVNGIEDCHKSCGCEEVPAWIDGYKEGLKAKINATTISDCPHKDEWHYPSKGEYPTTEEEVLVYLWDSFYIGTYCLDSSEINRWHFNDFDEQSDQITAWCYIKPPKEEE